MATTHGIHIHTSQNDAAVASNTTKNAQQDTLINGVQGDITGIKNNTLVCDLKTQVDANTTGRTTNATNITNNNTTAMGLISANGTSIQVNTNNISNLDYLNNFVYGRRLKLLSAVGSSTPATINLTSSEQTVVFQNIITNGNGVLSYDANGNLATSATGLFHIKAKISVVTTSGTGGGERMCNIELQTSSGTAVVNGKNHLSRHDNNDYSFASPEIDAVVRLASGTNYIFKIDSDDDGTGVIQNSFEENNDLIVRSLPLASGYSLATDYGQD